MLRECIEDLRLMIDSLKTGEDSLLVALVVEVEDDGHGFERTAASGAGRPAGRGLHNMELRARGTCWAGSRRLTASSSPVAGSSRPSGRR